MTDRGSEGKILNDLYYTLRKLIRILNFSDLLKLMYLCLDINFFTGVLEVPK